ncbi:hypothetical protein [Paraburkholderia sp. SIMBA_054]|uniref:hypothetical protein n=1 Tax=Paraburkholderia sp. SIMBA_054 TaxID=3085795 RepID=UPI0039780DC0
MNSNLGMTSQASRRVNGFGMPALPIAPPHPFTPIWQLSFEDFCACSIVIDIHRNADGIFVVGKAMGEDIETSSHQMKLLEAEYERRSPGNGADLLVRFKARLANSDFAGDVIVLSGSEIGAKHLVLNTMLVTPPNLLIAAYESTVSDAIARGESVHVPGTDEDPRERLLKARLM